MRILKVLIFIAVAGFIGWGIYNLTDQEKELRVKSNKLQAELDTVLEENKSLKSRVEYFQNPHNLLKEAKSQFNYREQDEKLIIIVPSASSTE